ncbi:hypothetical protein TorRG33x02_050350 [Trema orientale]|uniref:Uncharacterized protein n=1 Tax=Trema orientale TaxID=63057 RepID=A0A2P5FN02_TREOI|nr:hypothetical protein TorRG33x02_050350 [Trema orientale]
MVKGQIKIIISSNHHILILNIMFSIIFPFDKKNLFTRKSRVCITTNMYKHTLLQPSSNKRTWHNLIFCRKFSLYKNKKELCYKESKPTILDPVLKPQKEQEEMGTS